jgi:hypothetical protein
VKSGGVKPGNENWFQNDWRAAGQLPECGPCMNHAIPAMQTKSARSNWWMYLMIIVGVCARMWVGTLGHNYDLESYKIVLGILHHGGNVYAETERYNYGPVWFNVLHVLDLLSGHNPEIFRWLLIGLLSAVDIGIFCVLWHRFGRVVAIFFYLNPVSIFITGFHNQFDNLAIFLGLWAMLLFGDDVKNPVDRRKFCGLLVLGLSLMTKHVLFAFPCWLAVKQKGWLQKVIVVLVPMLVFLAGFLPYWSGGHEGIVQNVFHYRSFNNEYFYRLFVPQGLQFIMSSQAVWFAMLAIFAFVYRGRKVVESLLFYTAVLVIASPAVINQYLAIPVAFTATNINVFTLLYTAVATLHLLVDPNGLHRPGLMATGCADIAVCCLFFGVIWTTWKAQILGLLNVCIREVKNQWRDEGSK